EEDSSKFVFLRCEIEGNTIKIIVEDEGYGIENVEKAMEPLYTSKPELDRSGMGFTVMKSFMDDVEVSSVKDNGTRIEMTKKINVPK
ncbi:TPA: anti-sigma F factor, partial [Clostridioides difficile]|nr:anti-sigma F factor [Clostridioides difficile]